MEKRSFFFSYLFLFFSVVLTIFLIFCLLGFSVRGDRDWKRALVEIDGKTRVVFYKVETYSGEYVEKYLIKDEKSMGNDFVVYGYVEKVDPAGDRYVVWTGYEHYCPTDRGSFLEDIIRENSREKACEIFKDIVIQIDRIRHSRREYKSME